MTIWTSRENSGECLEPADSANVTVFEFENPFESALGARRVTRLLPYAAAPGHQLTRMNGGHVSIPREGELAPDFAAETDAGETLRLSSLRGKPVVLFFFPKDDTPT